MKYFSIFHRKGKYQTNVYKGIWDSIIDMKSCINAWFGYGVFRPQKYVLNFFTIVKSNHAATILPLNSWFESSLCQLSSPNNGARVCLVDVVQCWFLCKIIKQYGNPNLHLLLSKLESAEWHL